MSRPRQASRPRWQTPLTPTAPARPRRAPTVIMGMGNPLMGDEGIGWAVARALQQHPRLPADADVAWGGTDLLATAALLDGRMKVVLLDAVDGEPPGNLVRLDVDSQRLCYTETSDDALGLTRALDLLRMLSPGLDRVEIHVLGITVPPVRCGADLSAALRDRISVLAEAVLGEFVGVE